MNKKGFFCFLVVLCFAAVQLQFFSQKAEQNAEFAQAKSILFEIEKLDLERAALEENLDFLIKQAMLEEIKKQSNNSEAIKEKINEKVILFFEKKENSKELKIKFFSNNSEKISLEFLNANSNLLAINYENFVFAEYNFTGGLLKNNLLKARISSENAEKEFQLPIGYSQKAVLVKT